MTGPDSSQLQEVRTGTYAGQPCAVTLAQTILSALGWAERPEMYLYMACSYVLDLLEPWISSAVRTHEETTLQLGDTVTYYKTDGTQLVGKVTGLKSVLSFQLRKLPRSVLQLRFADQGGADTCWLCQHFIQPWKLPAVEACQGWQQLLDTAYLLALYGRLGEPDAKLAIYLQRLFSLATEPQLRQTTPHFKHGISDVVTFTWAGYTMRGTIVERHIGHTYTYYIINGNGHCRSVPEKDIKN